MNNNAKEEHVCTSDCQLFDAKTITENEAELLQEV